MPCSQSSRERGSFQQSPPMLTFCIPPQRSHRYQLCVCSFSSSSAITDVVAVGWRMCFWILGAFEGATLIGVIFLCPETKTHLRIGASDAKVPDDKPQQEFIEKSEIPGATTASESGTAPTESLSFVNSLKFWGPTFREDSVLVTITRPCAIVCVSLPFCRGAGIIADLVHSCRLLTSSGPRLRTPFRLPGTSSREQPTSRSTVRSIVTHWRGRKLTSTEPRRSSVLLGIDLVGGPHRWYRSPHWNLCRLHDLRTSHRLQRPIPRRSQPRRLRTGIPPRGLGACVRPHCHWRVRLGVYRWSRVEPPRLHLCEFVSSKRPRSTLTFLSPLLARWIPFRWSLPWTLRSGGVRLLPLCPRDVR